MSRTVTALYDSRSEAEEARTRLASSRIDSDRVKIIDQSSSGGSQSGNFSSGNQQQQLGDNGGFFSSLKDMFLPDEDSHAYSEGIRRGGYLLCAHVDEDQADEAVRILEQSSSVDFDQRQDQWKSEGWQGYTGQTAGFGQSSGTGSTAGFGQSSGTGSSGMGSQTGSSFSGTNENRSSTVEEQRIPIMEEQLRVGKREVNRGGARVRSYIVEQPAHEQVTLREEHVSVERRPVDEKLRGDSLSGSDLLQERTVEMTEMAEEAVVAKEARIKEELVVRKTAEEHVENIDETVRHTEVDVDEGMKSSQDRSAFGSFGSGTGGSGTGGSGSGGSGSGTTGGTGSGLSSETNRSDFERTDRDNKGF